MPYLLVYSNKIPSIDKQNIVWMSINILKMAIQAQNQGMGLEEFEKSHPIPYLLKLASGNKREVNSAQCA